MKKASLIPSQLKTLFSKRIKDLYLEHLKHQPKEITYQFFDGKLMLVIEESVTQLEQLLNESNHKELAKQIRAVLDNVIQPQLKGLIEELMDVKVVDFLSDTTIDTGRTGAIAVFELKSNTSGSVNWESGREK